MPITVIGLPQVQRNLKDFPRLLVMRAFAKALSRAAGVFEAELRVTTPETDYSTTSEEYGHLRDNIMSTVTIDTGGQGGRATIGFGKSGFVAMFVEYGHRLVSHSGKQTGTVAAHPFVRPAFETAANSALEAFTAAIEEYMQTNTIIGVAA